MPVVERRLRLSEPPERVFAACLDLLRSPDPARGVVERHCEPDPPVEGGSVVSTVRNREGSRELRSTVVRIDPPREVATANDGPGGAVLVTLRCEPDAAGTLVTLRSEAASGIALPGRPGRVLDRLLLGRGQRRAARATLARLQSILAGTSGCG